LGYGPSGYGRRVIVRRLIVSGILGCVVAVVLVPTALQAKEAPDKPKLPAACLKAFSSAEDAFTSFDEVFGAPGDSEDLGILGDLIDGLTSGDTAEAELDDLSAAANDGQSSEVDFFDSLETCLDKVRT
jgi:hypothetical protein